MLIEDKVAIAFHLAEVISDMINCLYRVFYLEFANLTYKLVVRKVKIRTIWYDQDKLVAPKQIVGPISNQLTNQLTNQI